MPAVVLLVGAEAALRDAELEALRRTALADAPRDFNEDRFDLAAAGLDPARILTAAHTLPVMAERRLVVVTGLGDRRAARFTDTLLPGYLEAPAPTTCLVLVAERVDRRLRWVKRVAGVGELRDCSGPRRPAEVRDWIEARIRAAGKRPARGAAATLFELVGANLDRLAFEIEKLCLFAGERAGVSADDVAEVTATLRPLAVYELCDAIGGRRLGEALRVLARIREQGEAPLAVLAGLGNHFRRLARARDCLPLEAGEVQRRLSLHPYAAQKLVEQARRFDHRRLLRCLDAVRRTDEALKGAVPVAPSLAIEQLVVQVCA